MALCPDAARKAGTGTSTGRIQASRLALVCSMTPRQAATSKIFSDAGAALSDQLAELFDDARDEIKRRHR